MGAAPRSRAEGEVAQKGHGENEPGHISKIVEHKKSMAEEGMLGNGEKPEPGNR